MKSLRAAVPAAASTFLFACAPNADSTGPLTVDTLPPTTTIDARPAALLKGHVIEWGELRPLLNEAAGGTVLREVVLDRLVDEALARAEIAIGRHDVEAERALFLASLDVDPNVATTLAGQVRDRRGLGEKRFARLLRRNAGLRALVAGDVTISEESIRRMHEIRHGGRRQGRLIVVASLSEAEAAVRRLEAGESFTALAVDVSIDSSAARGGLLEPINRADPSYPDAMRQALWSLEPGAFSPPILLGEHYALVTLEREIEGDGVELEDVRGEMARLVRLDQERILMDRLARRLLGRAAITILDQSLKYSWDANRRVERAARP